ncbi:MAG: metallophosphoesterase family protein [Desulfobacteraceae bacterium]
MAVVSDTHGYWAGLPRLFECFRRHHIQRLACLGDCEAEPFDWWMDLDPRHELYWVYDVDGSDHPRATLTNPALALNHRIFLAHTRATAFDYFKSQIKAYKQAPPNGRSPLLVCHGHTHTPCVTRFGRTLNDLLYIHSVARPYLFQPRRECLQLALDTVYLIVPGAFTLEEGRYPTLSFAILDLDHHTVEMISLTDVNDLKTMQLACAAARPKPGYR